MFHGWMFDPDGDQAAADSTRSSTSLDTGSSVNPLTARRLVTASYTSMIAYLTLIGSLVRSLNPLEWARTELKLPPGFLVRSAAKPRRVVDRRSASSSLTRGGAGAPAACVNAASAE